MKKLKVLFIITWGYFKCLGTNLTKDKTFMSKPTNDYWEKQKFWVTGEVFHVNSEDHGNDRIK